MSRLRRRARPRAAAGRVAWASALAGGCLLALAAFVGGAGAQQPAPETQADVIAVLPGPGGVGYWVVRADGTVSVAGTAILPNFDDLPPELDQPVVGARSGVDRALGIWLVLQDGSEVAVGDPGPTLPEDPKQPEGRLAGVATGELMRGTWWPDIDLACTARLPASVQIGQTIMPTLSEAQLGAAATWARRHAIAGVLVSGDATEHIWRRIDELQDFAQPIPLMIAVDEEGGRVQRLRYALTPLPSAARQTQQSTDSVEDRIASHARAMAELGFTVNFAPVVDVGGDGGIADRSFSDDPQVVADYAQATVNGLTAGGVLPVLKHFPGHGGADVDSHDALATTAPIDQLTERDLVPFAALIGTSQAAVMVGHLNVPGLTGGEPASLSPAAVDGLLRGQLGHDGLVVTDSLTMRAITDQHTVAEAALLAIQAGVDLALVGEIATAAATFDQLVVAASQGDLTAKRVSAAATNVLRAKGVYSCRLVGAVDPNRELGFDPALTER